MKRENVIKLNNAQGMQLRWLLERVITFNRKHHVLTNMELLYVKGMYNEISAYVCN